MYRQRLPSEFFHGSRDLLTMVWGVIPFGLIAGATGVDMGMSADMILGMTVLFFAGAAQLAAYQLIQESAPWLIIVLTSVVINLRFAIYSATFAPLLAPLARSKRWPLAYLLSDQVYGLCSIPSQMQRTSSERFSYLVGVAVSMWLSWVLSVLAGVVIGSSIPASWSLEFTIPLAFLALLVASISSWLLLAVAAISGLSAVLLHALPYNSGFILAVLAGVIGGLIIPVNPKSHHRSVANG